MKSTMTQSSSSSALDKALRPTLVIWVMPTVVFNQDDNITHWQNVAATGPETHLGERRPLSQCDMRLPQSLDHMREHC